MSTDKNALLKTVSALPEKKAKLITGKGAPKVLTGYVHGRYFRGLEPVLNTLSGDHEFSVELLIPKSDQQTMKVLMDAFDNTCEFMYNPDNKKDAKEKAQARRNLKNYRMCRDNFNAGKSNTIEVEVCEEGGEVETITVESGEFTMFKNGERDFHWPIKDGDLVRRNQIVKDASGDEVESSNLESSLDIGRGGEVAGHWLMRIKLKEKDWDGKDQRPSVHFPNKTVMTSDDLEEFVSLDCGVFKFEAKAYGDGGITLKWLVAQLKKQTDYRVLGTGGGDDSDDLEDEEFDDVEEEEENWDD